MSEKAKQLIIDLTTEINYLQKQNAELKAEREEIIKGYEEILKHHGLK